MLSENKFNMLLQRVVFDHEILTHRVVARSFKVDTSTAKKILAEFVSRSEGRAHATYILTGFVKTGASLPTSEAPGTANGTSGLLTSSNGSSTPTHAATASNGDVDKVDGSDMVPPPSSAPEAGPSSQPYVTELKTQSESPVDEFECVMLSPQDELQDKLALFSRVLSQDVYSVEPSKLPDLVLLTDANAPVLKDKELASVSADVLGTIKHYRPNVLKSGKAAKASTSLSAVASTSGTSKDKDKKKESSNLNVSSNKPDLKRKASSSEMDTKGKDKKPTSSKAVSPAGTKDKGKEREKVSTSKASNSNGPSLDDLFRVDSDKKKDTPAVHTKLKTQSSKQIIADDEEDFDGMLDDDDDMMAEIDALDTANTKKPSSSRSKKEDNAKDESKKPRTLQSGSRKKTRIVKRKEVTTNAKGFKVTKEVETEEEYTASDSDSDDGPVVASSSTASKVAKETKEKHAHAAKEKEKPKDKESAKEKPKLEKKPSLTKAGSSSSQSKAKAGTGGQTSLAGFFSKPKPKK